MSKRSRKMAKRDDYQNTLRAIEEAIGPKGKSTGDVPVGQRDSLKGGAPRAAKLIPSRKKR